MILAIFDLHVNLLLHPKFQFNWACGLWEISKTILQDGGCGRHLGFAIGSVLATLYLLSVPMLLIKFHLNWIIVFRGDVYNMNSQYFPMYMHKANTKAGVSKFDLTVNRTNVNIGPSF